MQSLSLLVLSLFYYLLFVSADVRSDRLDSPLRLREGLDKREHAKSLRGSLMGRELTKRSGVVTYDASCDAAPPKNSGYKKDDGFPTKKSIVQKAYQDALQLATKSASIGNTNLAFTHYFGGKKPDVQYTHYTGMMSAIASATTYYTIQFECSGTTEECSAGQSVAVTDATVGGPKDKKIVNICDRFWTSQQTKFLLYDASKGKNPGVPYRDDTSSGWCNKDKNDNSNQQCDFFQTAGHSILHELTHLDSLAEQAGLSPDDDGAHGTLDVQDKPQLSGARDYLKKYVKNSKLASPDYNAESYAATATEFYFMDLCSFREIKPLVSQGSSKDVLSTEAATNVSTAANTTLPTTSSYVSLATGSSSGYSNGTFKRWSH